MNLSKAISVLVFLSMGFLSKSQIIVRTNTNAYELAEKIIGKGVTILNPQIKGAPVSSGFFIDPTGTIGIDSGIVLSSGRVKTDEMSGNKGINGPAVTPAASYIFPSSSEGYSGDPDLTVFAGKQTFDATVLEFDFIPQGDSINVRFVFGSEEYPGSATGDNGYICSQYNDAFAFLIEGPGFIGKQNIALIPNTNIPVAINSINDGNPINGNLAECASMGAGSPFTELYIDNRNGQYLTYNGTTVVLTASAKVKPCSTYHIKLAIADAFDHLYDSGVFIEANSFSSKGVQITAEGGFNRNDESIVVEGCRSASLVIIRDSTNTSKPYTALLSFGGTAVAGLDYAAIPNSITFNPGESKKIIDLHPIQNNTNQADRLLKIYLFNGSCGSNPADSINFIIKDTIQLHKTFSTSVCSETGTHLTASIENNSTNAWLWNNGQTTQSIFINQPGNYEVMHQFNSTCFSKETFNVVSDDPKANLGPDTTICNNNNYVLHAGSGFQTVLWNTGEQTESIQVTTPGLYWVRVSNNNNCHISDSVKIKFEQLQDVKIKGKSEVCEGDDIKLNTALIPSAIYEWSNINGVIDTTHAIQFLNAGVHVSGTYYLKVEANNCIGRDTVDVNVYAYPDATISGNEVYCVLDTIHLNTSPVNEATYKWMFNNIPIGNTNNYINKAGSINQGGIYKLVVDYKGCRSTGFKNIIVNPIADINLGNDTSICENDVIVLNAFYPNTSYLWNTGSTASSITVNKAGLYFVNATYGSCTTTHFKNIKSNAVAYANAGPDKNILPGGSVQLNAGGYGTNATYKWWPEDFLNSSNVPNPVAMPSKNQQYVLTVTSKDGCIAKDSIMIFVRGTLTIPNAFSPNGDGINDIWVIPNIESLRNARIEVFNREGKLVYSSGSSHKPFDGTFNGKPLPAGTYYYIVQPNHALYPVQTGPITILR